MVPINPMRAEMIVPTASLQCLAVGGSNLGCLRQLPDGNPMAFYIHERRRT
jgi:hypothetical protein